VILCTSSAAVASPLPPGARARLGSTDLWHGPIVYDLAFAPDGKTFFSLSSADSAVRQWDAATGAETRAFAGPKGRVTAFSLSRDGRLLVTAGDDKTVRVWNAANGESLATWTRKLTPAAVALAPDGKSLAVLPGDEPDSVAVLDSASGKELHKFKAVDDSTAPLRRGRGRPFLGVDDDYDPRPEGTVLFSPDGRFLAVHASQQVTLWDTNSHKRVRRYDVTRNNLMRGGGFGPGGGFIGDVGGYVSLQFSSDSQTLLAAGGAGGVLRWDIHSVEPAEVLKADDVGAVGVAADAGVVAAGGRNGLILWNSEGKRLQQLSADTVTLTAVACSADGKTAVTGDRQGRLRIWDVAAGKELVLPGPRPVFRALAVSADGAVTCDEYAVVRWDAKGKEGKRFKLDPASLTDLLLSPDGRTLAAQQADGEVKLIDTATGEARATLGGKERRLTALQFSPDGRLLAALDAGAAGPGRGPGGGPGGPRLRGTPAGNVSIYDARTGKEVRQLTVGGVVGDQFVFLPDGRTLVSASSGDNVCLWETLTGKLRRSLPSPNATAPSDDDFVDILMAQRLWRLRGNVADSKFTLTPQQLAVSPDGGAVAAVQRNSVSVLDLQTGRALARLENHAGNVTCVAYSPDGRLLVTAGNDAAVHLWDGATGKEIGTLTGHRGPVRSASFAPDGKTLVTGSEDQTALVWDVAEAVKIARQGTRSTPSPRALEELWADLAGDDAHKADAAVRELASRPAEAVPLLKERLRPAAAADAKQVAKWIAELDDDDFAVRERAAAEIEKTGEQARAALEAALKNAPSQELKRRVTEFLKKLDERAFSSELVREMRALEALEKIGGPEAVKLLEALASGATNDARTQDAKATLERLKGK
jgi:WD40 repeat protein